ncbi:MAG: hypothetical protein WDM71_05480 [Ferruginibacter sp.]
MIPERKTDIMEIVKSLKEKGKRKKISEPYHCCRRRRGIWWGGWHQ